MAPAANCNRPDAAPASTPSSSFHYQRSLKFFQGNVLGEVLGQSAWSAGRWHAGCTAFQRNNFLASAPRLGENGRQPGRESTPQAAGRKKRTIPIAVQTTSRKEVELCS
jgi:hypothetical protein